MKRLRIEHKTTFDYLGVVTASYNELRMLPRSTQRQIVLSSSLSISPSTSVHDYFDYFGTRVSAFDLLAPHATLEIVANSLVEVHSHPLEHLGISWHRLRSDATRSVETAECLAQSELTEPHPEVAEIAQSAAAQYKDPSEAAAHVASVIGESIEYIHGVTGVKSTAAEAWAAGKGVCQDFTHITIGALRSVGIPARYVSGYLFPDPEAEAGTTLQGESHAWVEWFGGHWQGFDSTNDVEIGDRHVMVGRGRDYADVPPLRGSYAGPRDSELEVEVMIHREA